MQLNENRFENINKSPTIYSKSDHIGNYVFDKISGRKNVKDKDHRPDCYEGAERSKDNTLPKLNLGISMF